MDKKTQPELGFLRVTKRKLIARGRRWPNPAQLIDEQRVASFVIVDIRVGGIGRNTGADNQASRGH